MGWASAFSIAVRRAPNPPIFGHALLKRGAAAFDELRLGVEDIEFLADPTTGELRIGCTEAGAAGFVPVVIDALSRKFPKILFHVVTADPVTLADRELRQRNVELALGAVPTLADDADVVVEPLFDDRAMVMAGAKNKWTRRRDIALADLVSEQWLLPPADSLMGRYVDEAFMAGGVEPPRAQVRSFSIPLFHHLMATGQYLTVHPIIMAQLASYLPIKKLDINFSGIPRPIGIMTLKHRTISPLAKIFIDCARDLSKPLRARVC